MEKVRELFVMVIRIIALLAFCGACIFAYYLLSGWMRYAS